MMNNYPWTRRAVLIGVGMLAFLIAVVGALRIFGIVVAGVYPEAWVMTLMMTSPFTLAGLSLIVGSAFVVDSWIRQRRQVG